MSEEIKRTYDIDAIEYIARLADGGLRDSLSLLDKCLAYSTELTVENVVSALGTVDYHTMFNLLTAVYKHEGDKVISIIETVHSEGKDLKQFIKDFMGFLLDVCKYDITKSFDYLQLPNTADISGALQSYDSEWFACAQRLLDLIVKLNSAIKWDTQPKVTIEATLLGVINDG